MTDNPESGAETPDSSATTGASGPRMVDRKLLEILVCPLTKGPLRYDTERQELISDKAGLAYPVRDGIPIMLVDEARRLDDDQPRRAGDTATP
jgi:uncharacterized protein YbaR (Trm112 family)